MKLGTFSTWFWVGQVHGKLSRVTLTHPREKMSMAGVRCLVLLCMPVKDSPGLEKTTSWTNRSGAM